jgi:hypothetical protein
MVHFVDEAFVSSRLRRDGVAFLSNHKRNEIAEADYSQNYTAVHLTPKKNVPSHRVEQRT